MLPDWSSSIIYQIFPRSFYDNNNDGIGDIQGVIQKLDYLRDLGINTIWLNPVYQSAGIDAGYDVIDHTAIDPQYGTISDLDQLIKQAHKRHIKVMMDFLPNHTSDQHPWFVESSQNTTNAKRHWYTWREAASDGGPPNNWKSVFGGSAWTFDATTQQYYLHTFYPQQPDLNLRNPHVRAALSSIMTFYLSRGVDAFRIDAASHLAKDPAFRDNTLRKDWKKIADPYEQQEHHNDKNLADRFEIINEFSAVLDQYSKSFMITESYLDYSQLKTLHTHTVRHNHTACNFMLLEPPYHTDDLVRKINQYLTMCDQRQVVPTWILGNHDRTRIASKYGQPHARLLALLQLTLPGIPFIYYGEEIGMTAVDIPKDARHDTYVFQSRDGQRTPMQWNSQLYSGFSTHIPWTIVSPDYAQVNVEQENADLTSMLSMYKSILELRAHIDQSTTSLTNDRCIVHYDRHPYHITLNISDKHHHLLQPITAIFSTYGDKKSEVLSELRPFEGIISHVIPS